VRQGLIATVWVSWRKEEEDMRLSVAILVATCSLLATEAPPAQAALPAKAVGIFPIGYTNDCYIDPAVTVVIGQDVVWESTSGETRTVTQREEFWKFDVPAYAKSYRTMHSAGTFVERCDKGHWSHKISVPVRAPSKTNRASFRVRWANSGSPAGIRFSVRYAVDGSTFKLWKDRTVRRSAIFHASHGKTYRFEAQSIRSGKAALWSPPKIVKVS
jgi:hypothetical protein